MGSIHLRLPTPNIGRHNMRDTIGGFLVAIAVVGGSLIFTFGNFGSGAVFYVLPGAACIAALALPTTRFLIGYLFLFLSAAGILYGQHLYVSSLQPHAHAGSAGEAIGVIFTAFTVAGACIGAALNLAFRLGWRRWRGPNEP